MIANGIHAIGDSERKKLIQGSRAARVPIDRPNTSPSGTASTTEMVKPHATRNREAATSSSRRPEPTTPPHTPNRECKAGATLLPNTPREQQHTSLTVTPQKHPPTKGIYPNNRTGGLTPNT